jgi:hypothetical protein
MEPPIDGPHPQEADIAALELGILHRRLGQIPDFVPIVLARVTPRREGLILPQQ